MLKITPFNVNYVFNTATSKGFLKVYRLKKVTQTYRDSLLKLTGIWMEFTSAAASWMRIIFPLTKESAIVLRALKSIRLKVCWEIRIDKAAVFWLLPKWSAR